MSEIQISSATKKPGSTLGTIQACRVAAAVLVVLFHACSAIFKNEKYWNVPPLGKLFDFGSAGVNFFFVLSGFIILHAHWDDLHRPEQSARFARRRFVRVFPFYWLILLPLVLSVFLGFGNPGYREPGNLLQSIFLIRWDRNALLTMSVAWTLVHEVMFYFFFYLGLRFGRTGWLLFSGWISLSLLTLMSPDTSLLSAVYGSHLHLLFVFGMASAWLLRQRDIPLARLCALVSVLGFLITGLDAVTDGWIPARPRDLVYGFFSAMAICGLAQAEGDRQIAAPAWAVYLGSASYAIYLVHFPLISFAAIVFYRIGLPGPIAMGFFVALAITAGLVCHALIEKPLLQRLKPFAERATKGKPVLVARIT